MQLINDSWHYIVGLAGIGAVSAMAVTGTIAGADALSAITLVVGTLIGGGIAIKAGSTTPSPPSPPTP
jgi:hypothetical protein